MHGLLKTLAATLCVGATILWAGDFAHKQHRSRSA